MILIGFLTLFPEKTNRMRGEILLSPSLRGTIANKKSIIRISLHKFYSFTVEATRKLKDRSHKKATDKHMHFKHTVEKNEARAQWRNVRKEHRLL